MAETTFYSDSLMQVTNSRLIIGGKMYPMASIASVAAVKLSSDSKLAAALFLGGLLSLAIGFFSYTNRGACLGFGFILLAGFVAKVVYEVRNPKLAVVVESSSGSVRAVISRDRPYIQKMVDAINEAIIARG